ncbi:DUF1254 domain-containing protein [Paraburkholderia oxyphila]|uniref:DUF1254 domain-containing protein n=1 Tax=Paraburkholderia oxyphila TaxID=614212 RepID=UPI0005BB3D89|nr:DUF1254 domain-containing protein [Paraburkholderia oxyphila]
MNPSRQSVILTTLLAISLTTGFIGVTEALPQTAGETQTQAVRPSTAEIRELARDLYLYAYPIVLMDITMKQATNVPDATSVPMRAPVNQFAHFRSYPGSDARDVVRFNFDTLYSFAWVDLSKGPVILTVPDTHGRFYLVPSLDMWTDVFASVGSRTSGTHAGNYAYVPPGWKGTLPAGVREIKAPTSTIWVMGRIQTNGPQDYDNVHRVQDGMKLTPLSTWSRHGIAESVVFDPRIDGKTPPLLQMNKLTGVEMLSRLSDLMTRYPAHPNDYPILFRAQTLGFEPGKRWDPSQLDDATLAAINAGADDAREMLKKAPLTSARHVDGWTIATDNIGTYGTSYLRRALIAMIGLGANLPEDAIYPTAFLDKNGKRLDGANRYVLHFGKNELPPVDAFWSLTMYDSRGFQVANPLNRFSIGSRDNLRFNADGSLDLYIQHDSPGPDKESNWLPSPASGQLQPTLRLYAPRADVLDNDWQPPGFQPVN